MRRYFRVSVRGFFFKMRDIRSMGYSHTPNVFPTIGVQLNQSSFSNLQVFVFTGMYHQLQQVLFENFCLHETV